MAELALIATAVATVIGAVSNVAAGAASKEAYDKAAAQDILAGKNEFAAAQRDADERRLEGQLIMSRQQAQAAASGGGAGPDAPTITKILTDTGERVRYGTESVIYGGEQRRDAYFAGAEAKRQTGGANFIGGLLRGAGSLAGGVGRIAGSVPISAAEVG